MSGRRLGIRTAVVLSGLLSVLLLAARAQALVVTASQGTQGTVNRGGGSQVLCEYTSPRTITVFSNNLAFRVSAAGQYDPQNVVLWPFVERWNGTAWVEHAMATNYTSVAIYKDPFSGKWTMGDYVSPLTIAVSKAGIYRAGFHAAWYTGWGPGGTLIGWKNYLFNNGVEYWTSSASGVTLGDGWCGIK
jgi:hypothetical protein